MKPKVEDRRTTTTRTYTDVVTGEVRVREEHVDRRVLLLSRTNGLPDRWTKPAREGYNPKPAVEFQPSMLLVAWSWTGSGWYESSVELVGHQIRKDGSVGEREVKMHYYLRGSARDAAPEWLVELYDEFNPTTGSHPYTYPVDQKTADDDLGDDL